MKKALFIFLTEFYVFIFLGFVLHTSLHPTIFGKYTMKYFIFLIILIILFVPYIHFIKFSLKTSAVTFKRKKILISPFKKFVIYFLVLIFLIITPLELFLRNINIKHGTPENQLNYSQYIREDFHPFLQNQNVQKDNLRYKDFHINSYGFRGEEIQKKKPVGVYRIFILGGSTALNKNVPYEKNAARLLEKKLNSYYPDKKIEVQNAGTEWYTSEHSLIQYMFKIRDFDPDLVIMWHGINDMAASCTSDGFSQGMYQSDYSHWFGPLVSMVSYYYQPMPIINLIVFDATKNFIKTSLYSDITKIFISKNNNLKSSHKYIKRDFPSIDAYRRNINYLIKITKSDDVNLILGNQPYLFNKKLDQTFTWTIAQQCEINNEYPDLDTIIKGINSFNDSTKSIAEDNAVPFVDLESKIPKTLDYFVDDVHFMEKGNQIVANELFKTIVDNSLIQ